jgi:hypothetical protein
MSFHVKKFHAALKHGAFSATAILPGEDPNAFRELHEKLVAELKPVGPLEDDIVGTITRLLWRKQNLATLRIAEQLSDRLEELLEGEVSAEEEIVMEAAEKQARKELGEKYALVEIREAVTIDRLLQDLAIEERLDAMIDRCLKRLIHLRGLKSLSPLSPPLQPAPATPRIPGPK